MKINEIVNEDIGRRGFLKGLGAGAVASAVPGLSKAGEFVDVRALAQTDNELAEKVWGPRYNDLKQRSQDMLKKLIATAGPEWAKTLKGTTLKITTNENYAQANALVRNITLDLSVF